MNRILSLLAALSLIAGLSFLSTTAQAGPRAKQGAAKIEAQQAPMKARPMMALMAAPLVKPPSGLQLQALGGDAQGATCTSGDMDWMCRDGNKFVGAGQGCDVIGDYCQPVVNDGLFCSCGG